MKSSLTWIVLVVLAVAAAGLLGANDGAVSLYWRGWRLELSLNLFILAVAAAFVLLGSTGRLTRWLVALPERARAWRQRRREQALVDAQREAFADLIAARYSRSVKAAARALSLESEADAEPAHAPSLALSHLVSAMALHRLQNRTERDSQLQKAQALLGAPVSGEGASVPDGGLPADDARGASLREGSLLLQAEWALDDRQPEAALAALERLPPGAQRRIQAQRLRLQVHRLRRQPLEALRTARQLAKHQAFSATVAASLLRTLAIEVLDTARDADGLQALWLELERDDRRDVSVTVHAVRLARAFDATVWARRLLKPWLESATALSPEDRSLVCQALVLVLDDIETEWLVIAEDLLQRHPRETAVLAMAGLVFARRQLWGKAHPLLEQVGAPGAAASPPGTLHEGTVALRRAALQQLAALAASRGDAEGELEAYKAAARLG